MKEDAGREFITIYLDDGRGGSSWAEDNSTRMVVEVVVMVEEIFYKT